MGQIEATVYDIWLAHIAGMSGKQKKKLMELYGCSEAVFRDGVASVCMALTGKSLSVHPKAQLWRNAFQTDLTMAMEVMEQMEKKNIGAISLLSHQYPESLAQLPDAPWLLYYRGNLHLLEKQAVAVVGARKGTEYGRWAAFELSKRLGLAGVTVISGMACGVDACAHRGALEGSSSRPLEDRGSTIAVFGCGVDICYPRTNIRLMEQIVAEGLILSELTPGTEPRPFFFPQRNRIISGLSKAVVVAEAGLQSGSLITAELAAEQGKDVYAVPGNINRPCSIGTNKLIQDGACPIVVLDDILTEMGLFQENFTENIHKQLGETELKLYNIVLASGEMRSDELARALDFSISQVNALVTIMEMKGVLQTSLGKIFIAKS